MATYKEIKGQTVSSQASDPSSATDTGLLYYNTTSGTFKVVVNRSPSAGTWASGGTLNTPRFDNTGAGTLNAGLCVGGGTNDPTNDPETEFYNGSSWSEVNDLNTARYGPCTGTQTSALFSGGAPNVALTESWNGTCWTEMNDLNTGRSYAASAGADNQSIITFGGQSPQSALTELWDGTSWAEDADLNLARHVMFGTGSCTAALGSGGNLPPSPYSVKTEIWNGTSWTEVADMNAKAGRGGASGSSTEALIFGGHSGPTHLAKVEAWNGTSWTEVNDLSTARYGCSGTPGTVGSANATFCAGGNPPVTGATEEWNAQDFEVKTVTTS